jgi:hypothetical protein
MLGLVDGFTGAVLSCAVGRCCRYPDTYKRRGQARSALGDTQVRLAGAGMTSSSTGTGRS